MEELEKSSEEAEGGLLGLPETENELDVSHYRVFQNLSYFLLERIFMIKQVCEKFVLT